MTSHLHKRWNSWFCNQVEYMHQRIFHIRNGVVNSIGDAKYADNLCFHEKRFVLNCNAIKNRLYTSSILIIIRPIAKRAKEIRTMMLPCMMKGQGFKFNSSILFVAYVSNMNLHGWSQNQILSVKPKELLWRLFWSRRPNVN